MLEVEESLAELRQVLMSYNNHKDKSAPCPEDIVLHVLGLRHIFCPKIRLCYSKIYIIFSQLSGDSDYTPKYWAYKNLHNFINSSKDKLWMFIWVTITWKTKCALKSVLYPGDIAASVQKLDFIVPNLYTIFNSN